MKKPILNIAVFVAVFAPSIVYANDGDLTLNTAIEKTLQHNPQLQQFELKGRQLATNQEFAGLRPAYSIDLEVENFAGTGEFSGVDSAETTLALSSVIELGGKRDSRIQFAQTQIDQFGLERKIKTIDLLSSLTRLYIATLSLSERTRLAEESVGLYSAFLETVEKRVTKGIAPEAELIRVKSALVEEQLKLETLRSKQLINYYALAKYWGKRFPSYNRLNGSLYTFSEIKAFDDLFKQVESSPNIEIYASKARLKQAEIQLSKTANKADISWNIGVRQFQSTDDTALVAGFSIPLFSAKRNRATYKHAEYELEAVDIDKEQALNNLHQQLFSAYTNLEQAVSAEKRIRDEMIPQLEKAALLTLKGYERGRFTYQDVVSAQKELLSAKLIRVDQATVAQLNQSIIEQLIAKPLTKQ